MSIRDPRDARDARAVLSDAIDALERVRLPEEHGAPLPLVAARVARDLESARRELTRAQQDRSAVLLDLRIAHQRLESIRTALAPFAPREQLELEQLARHAGRVARELAMLRAERERSRG